MINLIIKPTRFICVSRLRSGCNSNNLEIAAWSRDVSGSIERINGAVRLSDIGRFPSMTIACTARIRQASYWLVVDSSGVATATDWANCANAKFAPLFAQWFAQYAQLFA